jgi:ketosteroid isomerase-like protein
MTSLELDPSHNITIVQQMYESFAKRDIPNILSFLDPNVEWGEPDNPFNPAGGTRHGHEGFLNWLKIGQESEDILILEPRKFLSNEDNVAIVGYTKCRANTTGKMYETDFVHLVTLKDGKVIKFQEFFDTFAAAEAFQP